MSPTDQIQDLFDRAFASVPAQPSPSPQTRHRRLRQRQIRVRLSTLGGGVLAVAISATALFTGLATNPAFAVTLYPNTSTRVATAQLMADQRVMTTRMRAVGYTNATVRVSHGALVVTNGPKSLTSSTSFLTTSPQLLIRSVTCYAGAQRGPVATSALPTTCSNPKYAAPTASPTNASTGGFTMPTTEPDPSLSPYATTTSAQDASSPTSSALLPLLNSGNGTTQRYLVGPTLVTLSSMVASATVTHVPVAGGWIVNVRLNAAQAKLWDQVAKLYFHRVIAIDLNGLIVDAPLIEPANSTFSSFDGRMQLLALSSNDAYDLAAALTSGPLAVPLAAHHS